MKQRSRIPFPYIFVLLIWYDMDTNICNGLELDLLSEEKYAPHTIEISSNGIIQVRAWIASRKLNKYFLKNNMSFLEMGTNDFIFEREKLKIPLSASSTPISLIWMLSFLLEMQLKLCVVILGRGSLSDEYIVTSTFWNSYSRSLLGIVSGNVV